MEGDVPARREEEIADLADPRAPWEELVEDPAAPRAMLAVMFTDIVGSTELATALGDRRWREVLEQHDAAIRTQIARFEGREVDTAGDAFFATFGLAVRAVDCALESARAVRRLGLRIRAGIHMGECVVSDGKVRGVTVHIGARVGAKARGDEVLVSSTVRDILAGAGLKFLDRGEQTLKGVEGRWRLYAVEPRARDNEADLPPLLEAEIAKPPQPAWRRPRVLVAAATALAILVGAIAYVTLRGPGGLSSVPADSVAVIDADSGDVESSVAVNRRPVGLAADAGGVWVANSIDRSVTRVGEDGATNTIPVGPGPIAVATGDDVVWVANGDSSSVSRVSPQTRLEVGNRIQAGNGLSAIAYGAGALWLANSVDGTVWRIDPKSGQKTMEVKVGPSLRGLAATNDAVWVTSESAGTLTQIDPRSGVIVRVVRVGNGPVAVAVGGGAAWVANADGTAARVDIDTGGRTATKPVGRGPRAIAVARSNVFVANEEDGTVSMLDGDTGAHIRTIQLRNAPMGLTAAGDRVWVSVRGGTLRYRGGTLRIGTESVSGTVDPSAITDPYVLLLVAPPVYDGLTSFKRVGGPEGNQLVPNLAEEIRPPTDNGTTYTFTLRPDLTYSDGTPVVASDVRSTFERILRSEGYGVTFVRIIKGSEACEPGKPCDLSAGIVTDDRARTIVFHLRQALADFSYQLALPSLAIVPGSAPDGDAGTTPIPGSGPYRIATAKIDVDENDEPTRGTVVLERNPRFEPRGLAQPDAYADRIEISMGGAAEDYVKAVKQGKSDVNLDFLNSTATVKGLATEFPAQFHVIDMPWNAFAVLNTKTPPFNDARVRRALNYAVDRRALANATGEEGLLGDISCQLLPKNTVGYIPYCPYTKDPNESGLWKEPDLVTARRLVAESGTAGQQVTVWTEEGDGYAQRQRRARGPIIAAALRAIGYRASVQEFPGNYFDPLLDPEGRLQIQLTGWISDYPAASNFILPLASCPETLTRLAGQEAFYANGAKFCSREVDALTERALTVQQDDPGAARDRWADVDRAITDAGPFLPFASLRNAVFVSSRVGNVQGHATYILLLTQMWVIEEPKPTPS